MSRSRALASDSYVDADQCWLRLKLQHKNSHATGQDQLSIKKKSAQYKQHYDAKIHFKAELGPNQCVFNEKLPLTDKVNTATKIAKASYHKLQSQKAGSFRISEVNLHTVLLDKEGIPHILLIHRVTAAAGLREHCSRTAQTPGSPKNKTH